MANPEDSKPNGGENGEMATMVGYGWPVLILIVAFCALLFFSWESEDFGVVTSLFVLFCAVVVTFLFGVRWGIATSGGSGATWRQFAVSVFSLLIIYAAVVLSGMKKLPDLPYLELPDSAEWPRAVSLTLLVLAVILIAMWNLLGGDKANRAGDRYITNWRTIVTVLLGVVMAIAFVKIVFGWPKDGASESSVTEERRVTGP